jgi:hypothetical protein
MIYWPVFVFTLSRAAVREVVVAGKPVVSEGRHLIQEEVVERLMIAEKVVGIVPPSIMSVEQTLADLVAIDSVSSRSTTRR